MTKARPDRPVGGDGVEQLADELRRISAEWGDLLLTRSRKPNRMAVRISELLSELRSSPDGRAAILVLLQDDDDAVRLCAAGDAVQWAPSAALPVLETLGHATSIHAVAAKYVVIGHREGTLPPQDQGLRS